MGSKQRKKVFWIIELLFFLMGMGAGISGMWQAALGAEVLVFLSVAVLPWCREKEVLWVFVLTVLVWLVTDLRFVWEYRELFLESGSRVKNLIFGGYFTIMLICAQVIGFSVIAGMIWKKQRYEYGTNEGEEDD